MASDLQVPVGAKSSLKYPLTRTRLRGSTQRLRTAPALLRGWGADLSASRERGPTRTSPAPAAPPRGAPGPAAPSGGSGRGDTTGRERALSAGGPRSAQPRSSSAREFLPRWCLENCLYSISCWKNENTESLVGCRTARSSQVRSLITTW